MRDLIIIGSSGFAREVVWIIEEINKRTECWRILGFISNDTEVKDSKYPILGDDEWLLNYDQDVDLVCAIGNGNIRKDIMDKLSSKSNFHYPNIIAPTVRMSDSVQLGRGCIICDMVVMTVNIQIGDFVICNLDCTVGHDSVIKSYVTLNPSVNVSGNVTIDMGTNVGTGTNIIQGKNIGSYSQIGAGAVIVSDIPDYCTAVGVPAKVIKSK